MHTNAQNSWHHNWRRLRLEQKLSYEMVKVCTWTHWYCTEREHSCGFETSPPPPGEKPFITTVMKQALMTLFIYIWGDSFTADETFGSWFTSWSNIFWQVDFDLLDTLINPRLHLTFTLKKKKRNKVHIHNKVSWTQQYLMKLPSASYCTSSTQCVSVIVHVLYP